MNISVVSGQMSYKKMTPNINDKEYAERKAHIWLHMLNDRMKPTKWLKPNKNGTKVNFDHIKSQAEYDQGLVELDIYLQEINQEFSFDLSIEKRC